MKKLTVLLLIILTVACILTSCATAEPANPFTPDMIKTPRPSATEPALKETPVPTPNPTATETPIVTPHVIMDSILEVTDLIYSEVIEIPNGYTLAVTGFFPQTGVKAIDDFYNGECENLKAEAEDFAAEIRSYEEADSFATQFMLDNDYVVIKNSGGIFSVCRPYFIYSGGAHGMNFEICDNFRISDGKRLTLDDIFNCTSDEYIADICRIFDAFIDANSYDGSDYYFFGDAKQTLRDIFPIGEFCITDTGLNFYISPYYIAPYVAGTVVIPVAWDDLTVARNAI